MIELLVVVSIVALLIALLLPALGAAKEQAVRIACISNLRTRGLAYVNYAIDFQNYLPHVVEDSAYQPEKRYTAEMSQQLATYTGKDLASWWCPPLWQERTKLIANWETWTFQTQAENSVAVGGFFKTVPLWSPEAGAWGYRDSVFGSRAADGARSPVFLATALYDPTTPVPAVFGGGVRVTFEPRLQNAPGASLTVAEMYPTLVYVGNHLQGGQYRHRFAASGEGGNVLRVDGSARWYGVGTNADWHWYLRENWGGAANPKQAVIQPMP